MNIDDLTIGEARELARMFQGSVPESHPYKIGEAYAIRTVTMHHVGKLVAVYPQELVLEGAAWVADSGRWHNALETGEVKECEPFLAGPVIVGRGGIIDACVWKHELLRTVK